MNPQSQVTLYQTADGSTELDVHIYAEVQLLTTETLLKQAEMIANERVANA